VQLREGAPTIAFRDLCFQERENDLVCATFGRGFYVLDDYTPLRYINGKTLAKKAVLFKPRDAWVYNELGHVISACGNFTTPNPPFGATVHYYLSGEIKLKGGDQVILSVKDAMGRKIREIPASAKAGLHRVVWDLRGSTNPQAKSGGHGGRKRPYELVEPGEYTISLLSIVSGKQTVLGKSRTIQVKATIPN